MILKTYARVVTDNVESTLALLLVLTGKEPDVRFTFGDTEIVAIGDFCIISAPPEKMAALREIAGPVLVDNLEQTQVLLLQQGATITVPPKQAPTGSIMYAQSREGILFEFLQYTTELMRRVVPSL